MFRNMRLELVLCGFMLFSLSGCFTMNQIGTPTSTAIELTNSGNATTTKSFTRTKRVNHFIYGLVSPEDAGVEKTIDEAVRANSGSKAVNVKMRYQMTFVDGLIGVITFGIYQPFTLTISGDVVQ